MDVLQGRNGGIEVVRFGRVPDESKYDSVRSFSLVRTDRMSYKVKERRRWTCQLADILETDTARSTDYYKGWHSGLVWRCKTECCETVGDAADTHL